jgi:hypothetical protein
VLGATLLAARVLGSVTLLRALGAALRWVYERFVLPVLVLLLRLLVWGLGLLFRLLALLPGRENKPAETPELDLSGISVFEDVEPGSGAPIRVYGDEQEINPAKVYVDVLAEFTREGFLRPCRITWENGRKYNIDRVKRCERRASRKAGGMGLMYTCMIEGQEVNLFYEENQRWFVTRK